MKTDLDLFGEVLFDCFADGSRVLGGAPFNVSWHLRAFGLNPRLISRVGTDAEGDAILQAMADWDMERSGVGRDPRLPTGRVEVALQGGEPSYEIVHPAAWDAIETPPRIEAGNWLYHGSLAQRDERSRQTLEGLIEQAQPRIFVDVNLRDPWWDGAGLARCLQRAHWAKLNRDELALLAPEEQETEHRALALLQRAGLEGLVVTCGAAGAMILDAGGVTARAAAPAGGQLRDTVGAGDAFAAVVLLGLIRGWPPQRVLARALDFAAAVCGIAGATTTNPDFYQAWLQEWGLQEQERRHV